MCVRFGITKRNVELWRAELGFFGVTELGYEGIEIDVFPGAASLIALQHHDGSKEICPANWGMVPPWAKELSFGKKNAYNARSETVTEKPTFRQAYKYRRCIVPATSFFERSSGRWLRMAADPSVLGLAGLYENPNDLSPHPTFAMVTTVPNNQIADVHDRMPVVLQPEDYSAWLDHESDPHDLLALLLPCPEDLLGIEEAEKIGAPLPAMAQPLK